MGVRQDAAPRLRGQVSDGGPGGEVVVAPASLPTGSHSPVQALASGKLSGSDAEELLPHFLGDREVPLTQRLEFIVGARASLGMMKFEGDARFQEDSVWDFAEKARTQGLETPGNVTVANECDYLRQFAPCARNPEFLIEQACIVSERGRDMTSLTFGMETMSGCHTVTPAKKSQIFSTCQDNQPAVNIQVFEGERPMAKDSTLLGNLNSAGSSRRCAGSSRSR